MNKLETSFYFHKLSKTATIALVFLFFFWNGWSQSDLTINTGYTISEGTVLEVNDLYLDSNAILDIEGTLIIRGNITMANNSPIFNMGNNARVIVYGNFLASNKMQISISSYLIIYGDFLKVGSSNQGDLTINNGNIYIFGQVDPDWTDLQTCSTYSGTTTNENFNCDYGRIDEYEKNYESLPSDLKDELTCFTFQNLTDKSICAGNGTEFNIDAIPSVDYQWQVKTPDSLNWTNTGTNSIRLAITATTAMNGNKYRVVLKSNGTTTCKISITNVATLTVTPSDFILGAISGPTEICAETTSLTYSIPDVPNAASYIWTIPEGWGYISGSGSSSIQIKPEETTGVVTLKLSITSTCGTVKENHININVKNKGRWTGQTNTDWFTATNWECNTIPTSEYNVMIPSGISNYPVITSGIAKVKNFSIQAGASVTLNGGTIEIYRQVQNSGSFNSANGTVIFMGIEQQIIPTRFFSSNRVKNLLIRNASGVTSSASIEVTEILKVEKGTFNTGNALTLISSEEKTALIDGSGPGTITGNITIQRYLDNSFGYKYFSSPFQNSTVGDFASYINLSESFPTFYSYNENRKDTNGNDATGWEVYTASTATLNPIEGYALNFGELAVPKTVEISGTVNNGNYSRTLFNNDGLYTQGFNMVGNPYPSPINWDAATGWTKTNVDNAIYFFTAGTTNRYTGTYSSYVNGISSSDGKSSNIIPSMQGFLVHVSDITADDTPTAGSLAMTNEVRVIDFAQEFLKAPETGSLSLIRIVAGLENHPVQDHMVIYFNPFAATSFEKELDALKMMNTDTSVPNLYCITPGKQQLSINAIPFSSSKDQQKIPLGLKTEQEGWMVINLKDLENLPSSFNVYLIDTEKRISQNLSEKSSYKFFIKAGQHDSRFHLVFSENKLKDLAEAFDEKLSVKTIDGQVYAQMNLELNQSGTLVTGQILEQKTASGKETIELKGIKSSGIYFISLSLDGEMFSKKVLIQK